MMNGIRKRKQTAKRVFLQCRLGASLALSTPQSHSIRPYYFWLFFSAHPIKYHHRPHACQLHASLLPLKHYRCGCYNTSAGAAHLCLFFFFLLLFLPVFLAHTHTQMLSRTLSVSVRQTHSRCLSVTSSYF